MSATRITHMSPQQSLEKITGAAAIRKQLADFFEHADKTDPPTIYGVCNIDVVKVHFPEWGLSSVDPSKAASGLKSKFIYTSSSGPELKGSDHTYNRESRYLSDHFSTNMTVVGSSILFVTQEDGQPVGYAVTSEGLATDMISLFEVLWNRAEE